MLLCNDSKERTFYYYKSVGWLTIMDMKNKYSDLNSMKNEKPNYLDLNDIITCAFPDYYTPYKNALERTMGWKNSLIGGSNFYPDRLADMVAFEIPLHRLIKWK